MQGDWLDSGTLAFVVSLPWCPKTCLCAIVRWLECILTLELNRLQMSFLRIGFLCAGFLVALVLHQEFQVLRLGLRAPRWSPLWRSSLLLAHLGSPRERAVKRCVCVSCEWSLRMPNNWHAVCDKLVNFDILVSLHSYPSVIHSWKFHGLELSLAFSSGSFSNLLLVSLARSFNLPFWTYTCSLHSSSVNSVYILMTINQTHTNSYLTRTHKSLVNI